jgi:hypothetical protein
MRKYDVKFCLLENSYSRIYISTKSEKWIPVTHFLNVFIWTFNEISWKRCLKKCVQHFISVYQWDERTIKVNLNDCYQNIFISSFFMLSKWTELQSYISFLINSAIELRKFYAYQKHGFTSIWLSNRVKFIPLYEILHMGINIVYWNVLHSSVEISSTQKIQNEHLNGHALPSMTLSLTTTLTQAILQILP